MQNRLIALTLMVLPMLAAVPFEDRTFRSKVFGQERHYRLFLPAGYEAGSARYPVIYYFHGHSDRYTLERYDDGKDTVPKIARFVANHPVIVISVDGYVAEDYTGFYGGSPWDVRENGGKYDFGEHFKELVSHIDSTLRTIGDRRHRATSGLSMGGYMSLYVSARFPDLIGSASSFNAGPEFYAGETGRRVLWRPKDHVLNHTRSMIRLIRASGDFISQYHEETRTAYAREERVGFEYRQDDYHRHWATSIGETFEFHMRAFETPVLSNVPDEFHHDNAHERFSVWGWDFATKGGGAGYTVLRNVTQSGLRVETQRWAPDGPAVEGRTIEITTSPIYKAGTSYTIIDAPLGAGEVKRTTVTASADGRLRLVVDGGGRQVSITGPGAGVQQPALLPVARGEGLRVMPGVETPLPIWIYNPRTEAMKGVEIELLSDYPTVELLSKPVIIPEIASGGRVDLSKQLRARFTAGAGDYRRARIKVNLSAGWPGTSDKFDVLIAPDGTAAPAKMEILDGRTKTFNVFRQKGNQGGGAARERTVTEGRGNGNGVLEPGEEATVWVRIPQGLDPFDKGNWRRVRIYCGSPWVEEIDRIEEEKEREWTGAKDLTSVIRLSAKAPADAAVPAMLRAETWSFDFTPDVRYGVEPLYQAIQLHQSHIYRVELRTGGR
ncbi:MAG TPA: alpha/beta hydrolase-fold protein [Bryobacteraceae bacterium]|nr:alpha/beta hydrolase-fold protein [Bryobacteraceae bacterium]